MKQSPSRPPLSHRVLNAGFWSAALRGADQLIILARTLILATMLGPDDFGLFGIAMIAVVALQTLAHTGFSEALIHKPAEIAGYFDVTWTVSVIRGVLLSATLWVGAPHVATFFAEPGSEAILRTLSPAPLIAGLANPGVVYFRRELEFRKEFLLRFSSAVADLLVAVGATLWLRSATALVLGFLAGAAMQLLLSYAMQPYRPRFSLAWRQLAELFHFGSWVWLSGLIMFLSNHAAGIFVGKALGAVALGLFQMADRIPRIVMGGVTQAISSVAFPTYAKLQGERAGLAGVFLRISAVWIAVAAPTAAGIAVVGPDFVRLFLGEAWLAMATPLAVLSLAILIRTIVMTGRPLFLGCGQPRLTVRLQAIGTIALVVLIYPMMSAWGTTGVALAMLASSLTMVVPWYAAVRRLLGLGVRDLTLALGPPLLSSLAMAGVVLFVRRQEFVLPLEGRIGEIGMFLCMIAIGALTYGTLMLSCLRLIPGYTPLAGVGFLRRN